MPGERKPAKRECLYRAGVRGVRCISQAVDFVLLALLLLLLFFGCYCLWDSRQVYEAADTARYEIYKPKEEDSVSFQQLQEMNSEVLGWLTVYGTGIDYPLVQAENNEKYLNINVKEEFSAAGSLFLHYRNRRDFSDYNTIIFGHHMAESAMFGDIGKFTEKEYFDSHPYGNLYYEGKDHGIEFFAFLLVDAYDGTVYNPAVDETAAQQEYLSYLLKHAMHRRDVMVRAQDRLVLLSTCTSDITNGRHILVGRILDETVKDPYKREEEEAQVWTPRGIDAVSLYESLREKPVILWAVLLLAALFLVAVVTNIWRRKRRKSKFKRRKGSRGR